MRRARALQNVYLLSEQANLDVEDVVTAPQSSLTKGWRGLVRVLKMLIQRLATASRVNVERE